MQRAAEAKAEAGPEHGPGSVHHGCAGLRPTEMLWPHTPEASAQAHTHGSSEEATWPGAPRCLTPGACLVCGRAPWSGTAEPTDGRFKRTTGIRPG